MNLDFRTMDPKMFMELFPALVPVETIETYVLLKSGKRVSIPPPLHTISYPDTRPSYETLNSTPFFETFGPAVRAPLGSFVHARSGDKGNNANIGFFVGHHDEYRWLQSFLTVARLKELFAEDWRDGYGVERCEFPRILAVHL
jgi:hypothetical protein